jgi:hypothetical protein
MKSSSSSSSTFCAVCTADIVGEPRKAPLGKNNALVSICVDCDTETPIARTGPARCYDEGGGASVKKISDAAKKILPRHMLTNDFEQTNIVRSLRPGHILLRHSRRDQNGKSIDVREAFESIHRRHGIIDGLKYVGSQREWFLFERPDPKVVKKRMANTADPIAELEKLGTRTSSSR